MRMVRMRLFKTALSVLLLAHFGMVYAQDIVQETAVSDEYVEEVQKMPTESELRERLSLLSSCMPLRITGAVKNYIHTYTVKKSDKTVLMLGRRLTYFPLFEQKLQEAGLPQDLKYLAVVESALNPQAVSRAGAVGLWQFMPTTGREYGLLLTKPVDERVDPVQSTEAAIKLLKNLYRQYNDWALALAAYNSGPGRVNAAIRRARSRNFWRIQAFLPTETRNYVPAFIAATYICNYHLLHGLEPKYPEKDEQLTAYIKVFEAVTFREIAGATGVEYQVVKNLNPGYRQDYVPGTAAGYYVTLPERVMPAFIHFLNGKGQNRYIWEVPPLSAGAQGGGDGKYVKVLVQVEKSDHIERTAKTLLCYADHLKAWNQMASNYVQAGQTLTVWRPVHVLNHQRLQLSAHEHAGKPLNRLRPASSYWDEIAQKNECAFELPSEDIAVSTEYAWHILRRGESLDDVARQYGVTIDRILQLNPFTPLKTGARLKIKPIN